VNVSACRETIGENWMRFLSVMLPTVIGRNTWDISWAATSSYKRSPHRIVVHEVFHLALRNDLATSSTELPAPLHYQAAFCSTRRMATPLLLMFKIVVARSRINMAPNE